MKKKTGKSGAAKSVRNLPAKTLSPKNAKGVRGGFTLIETPVAKKGTTTNQKVTFPTPW